MKRYISIIGFILLCFVVQAQSRIRFVESDRSKMPLLSRTVSIDVIHDSVYIAYGNSRELAALSALGYSYELVEEPRTKGIAMANTIEQMASWDRYPTYPVYLQMMQNLVTKYPDLCTLDTIGFSVEGRLILCVCLTSNSLPDSLKPQFFYSSTIHGDELTGFHLMLHLIDTLLSGYGRNDEYTALLDSLQIFVNPLSNPDGTYHGGDNSVDFSQRYNALSVDLNRNYPDPFGPDAPDSLQLENQAMIRYVGDHHFRIAANIHGGAEVLNYPWDSFRSSVRRHPDATWWERVCRKFIDTLRNASSAVPFDDVSPSGYVAGGDWYVIPNGRQDYMNATHGILEMTLELSVTKRLPGNQLPIWWQALQHSLVGYIHACTLDTSFILAPDTTRRTSDYIALYPNPASGQVTVAVGSSSDPLCLYCSDGRLLAVYQLTPTVRQLTIDVASFAPGFYIIRRGTVTARLLVIH